MARPLVRVPISGDYKAMVIGVITLQTEQPSRIIERFVQHCQILHLRQICPWHVCALSSIDDGSCSCLSLHDGVQCFLGTASLYTQDALFALLIASVGDPELCQ